jgi:hypothetical protein
MDPVLVAPGAVFPIFHALRMLPPVLRLEEVAALALGALENDLVARHLNLDAWALGFVDKLATGIEPVTSSLPRMRSTD